jgi:prepilin-type N-terminal cleavage/methylation domain-containing protein
MSNLLIKKDKGFTLIEIVLVLAIAGLLLLIVFLAVSGAQRSRRDSQRKNDAARLLAQGEQYASNNNGSYPNSAATAATFVTGYLNVGTWNDPTTGATYAVTYGVGTTNAAGQVRIASNAQCANGLLVAGGGARVMGVQIFAENGGSYCVDNH